MQNSSPWLALVLLISGCPDPIDQPSDKTPFDCTIGQVTDDSTAVFTPLVGGRAELVLGFQGFLTVPFYVSARSPPEVVDVRMQLDVDGADTVSGEQPGARFHDLNGAWVSDELLLFLTSDSIGAWKDHDATITVRMEDDTHACIASAEVVLVDDVCEDCP